MREYLQSTGYTVLRWMEWTDDHYECEVITPSGERIVVDDPALLLSPRSLFRAEPLRLVA